MTPNNQKMVSKIEKKFLIIARIIYQAVQVFFRMFQATISRFIYEKTLFKTLKIAWAVAPRGSQNFDFHDFQAVFQPLYTFLIQKQIKNKLNRPTEMYFGSLKFILRPNTLVRSRPPTQEPTINLGTDFAEPELVEDCI